MQSVGILINVLQEYEGSFVIYHDRYFLSQVANKIWWIENAEVKEYPSDYEEYEYSRSQQKAANQAIQKLQQPEAKAKKEIAEKKRMILQKKKRKEKKKLSSRVQQLETELVKLRGGKRR